MYTKIQTLVDAAYRRSGTIGDGQTPTSNDSSSALEAVNGILDTLALDGAFTPGLITRDLVVSSTFPQADVTQGSRQITISDMNAGTGILQAFSVAAHGLIAGDTIHIYGTSVTSGVNTADGDYVVLTTPTPTTFTASGALLTNSDYPALWVYQSELAQDSGVAKAQIANIPARQFSTIATGANPSYRSATLTTVAAHALVVGESVDLYATGIIDGTYQVKTVTATSFTVTGIPYMKQTTVYNKGTWKKTSEGFDYVIALPIEPPTRIEGATSGGIALSEVYADAFYSRPLENGEWYFEGATDPYAAVYSPNGACTLTFRQPGFVNVTLNTSLVKWPRGLDQAVMYKLAGVLAAGYPETVATCEAAYNNAISSFKIAHRKTRGVVADDSSPGYNRRNYDFDNDTWE